MKTALAACLLALLAACTTLNMSGLVPGQSTEADVEHAMGRPVFTENVNGETWLYYTTQPYGRQNFVARIAPDGRLIDVEKRLTQANIDKLQKGKTTEAQVRELLGPPERVDRFKRMSREVWTYRIEGTPYPQVLYVQFSPDRTLREVYQMDDPEFIPRNDAAGNENAGFRW